MNDSAMQAAFRWMIDTIAAIDPEAHQSATLGRWRTTIERTDLEASIRALEWHAPALARLVEEARLARQPEHDAPHAAAQTFLDVMRTMPWCSVRIEVIRFAVVANRPLILTPDMAEIRARSARNRERMPSLPLSERLHTATLATYDEACVAFTVGTMDGFNDCVTAIWKAALPDAISASISLPLTVVAAKMVIAMTAMHLTTTVVRADHVASALMATLATLTPGPAVMAHAARPLTPHRQ